MGISSTNRSKNHVWADGRLEWMPSDILGVGVEVSVRLLEWLLIIGDGGLGGTGGYDGD